MNRDETNLIEGEQVPDLGQQVKERDYVPAVGNYVQGNPSGVRTIYDPEATRRLGLWILTALIGTVLILSTILAGLAIYKGGDEKLWGIAREFLSLTFSPLVALFGAAIAYYYTANRD